jgi:hypothetical protein
MGPTSAVRRIASARATVPAPGAESTGAFVFVHRSQIRLEEE